MKKRRGKRVRAKQSALPIQHWSHSSLLAYLRNPLAWYKRYVEKIYDTPRSPSAVVGSAGHKALEHYYSGVPKELAIARGLEYLRAVPDFELNFGKAKSKRAQKAKRAAMEREYLQAIGFYLARAPRHEVVGVEVAGVVEVAGLPLPLKAVSDLVVASRGEAEALDIIDHKFVDSFSKQGAKKTLFVMQALFNYYTVGALYGKPVRRFIVYECKKTRNADGSAQLRRYELDFATLEEEFGVFHRLIKDATEELTARRRFLPNPSDMFDGEESFDLYRLRLSEDEATDPR